MNNNTHFVICIENDDYPASLELKKVYVTIEDTNAAKRDLLRVIDESGEDYLYPARLFEPILVSDKAASLFAVA